MQQTKRQSAIKNSVASSRVSVEQRMSRGHHPGLFKEEASPEPKKKRQVNQSGLKQFDAVIAMVEQTRIRPPSTVSTGQSRLLQPMDLCNTNADEFQINQDDKKSSGNAQLLKRLLRDQVQQRHLLKKVQRENERLSDLVDRLSAQNAQLFANQKRLQDVVEQKHVEKFQAIEDGLDHRFQMVKAHLSRLAGRIQQIQDNVRPEDIQGLLKENVESRDAMRRLQEALAATTALQDGASKQIDAVQQQSRQFQELFQAQERQIVETQYMVARVQDSVCRSRTMVQSGQFLEEYAPLGESGVDASHSPKSKSPAVQNQTLQEQISTLLERIGQVEMAQLAAKPLEITDSKLLLFQSQLQILGQRHDELAQKLDSAQGSAGKALEAAQEAAQKAQHVAEKLDSAKLQESYLQEKLQTKFDAAKLEKITQDIDEKNEQLDALLQELTAGFSDVSQEVRQLKQAFKNIGIEAESTTQIQKRHGKDIETLKQAVAGISQAYDAFTKDKGQKEEMQRFVELQIKDQFIKTEQRLKQQHENEFLPLLEIINEKIKAMNRKLDTQQQSIDTKDQIQQTLYQQLTQHIKTFQGFVQQSESEIKKLSQDLACKERDFQQLHQTVGEQFKTMGDVIESLALTMEHLEQDLQKIQGNKQLENTIVAQQAPDKRIQELQDMLTKQKNDTSELVSSAVQVFLEGFEDLRRRIAEVQNKGNTSTPQAAVEQK